jgi:hypothetical protein
MEWTMKFLLENRTMRVLLRQKIRKRSGGEMPSVP